MPITPFPPAPSRSDPTTFPDKGDAYLSHLEAPFVAEVNALEANVNAKEASTNALALAAVNAVNISAWASGTTYAVGVTVYDPVDLLSYRRSVAGAGTTRPGLDNANWVVLNGLGNVRLDSNQTFTGVNTFSQPINGSGANLTNLDASNMDSGTVAAARLPAATETDVGALELATTGEAQARLDNTKAMTPLRTQEAVDAIFSSLQTVVPSSLASVTFNNLTLPRYTVLLDGLTPLVGNNQLVLQVSSDNGTTWTNVYTSESVNWQANGGLSGAIQLFTSPCTGFAATGYRNVVASNKNGSRLVVPTGTGNSINAIRLVWSTGNFSSGTTQKIQLFRE
jgi:hypothetical protein